MPCKIVGGTKVPGNEKSWERKFLGTKGPGNSRERKVSRTKVPHRDYSFLGRRGLGHEKSRYPIDNDSTLIDVILQRRFLSLLIQIQIQGCCAPICGGSWVPIKRLNSLICRLGCGLKWPKDSQVQSYRQVAPKCPHGRTHCRHLANMIEPPVYGGNAPYVKLL